MQLCSPIDKLNTRATQRPRCFRLAYPATVVVEKAVEKKEVSWMLGCCPCETPTPRQGPCRYAVSPAFATRALTTRGGAGRDSRLVARVKSFAFIIGPVRDLPSVYRLQCCNSVVTIPAEVP